VMGFETIDARQDSDGNLEPQDLYLELYHDENCVVGTYAEVSENACFFYAEVKLIVTSRDWNEEEYKYQMLGLLHDDLVEQFEREKLCGARKPDQYLQHAYLCDPNDPCYDFACVKMERSDHCG
jgi:hypothetical protein